MIVGHIGVRKGSKGVVGKNFREFLGKPLIDCAMYDLEAQITTIIPGETPCLSCLYPTHPERWKREFPVFGAVSGTVGCLGALEAIKVIAGLGETLAGQLLLCDLRTMRFRRVAIARNPDCEICGQTPGPRDES